MTRIDRYLLVLYVRVLFICFISLSGLLIVVHLFTNLDEFIEYGNKRDGLLPVLANYYGPYILSLFNQLSGLLALLSLMFVVAWLYRTNELTAILAAGISKGRVVTPLLIASFCVFVLASLSREFLIPRFAGSLDKSPQDLIGKGTRAIRPSFDLDYGLLIGGRHLLPETGSVVDILLRVEGPAAGLAQQITANSADYVEPDGNLRGGYVLRGVQMPAEIHNKPGVVADGIAYALTAKDVDWLKADECFVASNLRPEMLNGKSNWVNFAPVAEMIQRIRTDPRYYGDDVRVAMHSKILQPLSDFTLVLFGLPIVLSRPDRHLFWVAGASICIIGGFSAVLLSFQMMGNSEGFLLPSAAVWVPVLICGPIAWARARTAMRS